jgi:hypothetical protein
MRIDRPTKDSPTIFFAGTSRVIEKEPVEEPKEPVAPKAPKQKES